jgi:hypothetical protein
MVCIVALCQVWQTSIEYGGADPINTNLVLWRSLEYRLSFRIQLPVAAKLSAITSWDGNSDMHHPLSRTSVQIAMWSAQAPAVSRIRQSDWLRLQRNPQHSPLGPLMSGMRKKKDLRKNPLLRKLVETSCSPLPTTQAKFAWISQLSALCWFF